MLIVRPRRYIRRRCISSITDCRRSAGVSWRYCVVRALAVTAPGEGLPPSIAVGMGDALCKFIEFIACEDKLLNLQFSPLKSKTSGLIPLGHEHLPSETHSYGLERGGIGRGSEIISVAQYYFGDTSRLFSIKKLWGIFEHNRRRCTP